MTNEGYIKRISEFAKNLYNRELSFGNEMNPLVTGDNIRDVIEVHLSAMLVKNEKVLKPSFDQVRDAVCEIWKIGRTEFQENSKSRFSRYSIPRHAICKFMLDNKLSTTLQLGRDLNRDHSTVIHGRKVGNELYHIYKNGFREKYDRLIDKFYPELIIV